MALHFLVVHYLILMLQSAQRSCGKPQPKTHDSPINESMWDAWDKRISCDKFSGPLRSGEGG